MTEITIRVALIPAKRRSREWRDEQREALQSPGVAGREFTKDGLRTPVLAYPGFPVGENWGYDNKGSYYYGKWHSSRGQRFSPAS